jgi:hypothetical protein
MPLNLGGKIYHTVTRWWVPQGRDIEYTCVYVVNVTGDENLNIIH